MNRLFAYAVTFEVHRDRSLERFGGADINLDRANGDASGRDEDLSGLLRTEAATQSSAIGHSEKPKRTVPCVADTHFQHMRTKRLFAEIVLHFLDDQTLVAFEILLWNEDPEPAPNKQDHGERQAEPGNLRHHRHTGS